MAKTKQPPENPFLPEHHKLFDGLVKRWQKRLNLFDWRIEKKPGRTTAAAEVFDFQPQDRLVRYRLGADYGAQKVTDDSLEELAIHEMLHVFFNDLIDAAMEEGEYNDRVVREEHAVIIVASKLLHQLSQLEREKEAHGSTTTHS